MATGTNLFSPPDSGTSDPISSQFGKIRSMFGMGGTANPTPGTTPQPARGNVITEPIEGNSLDRITRSLTNLLGQTGADTMGTGTAVFSGGLDVAGTGLSLYGQPLDYWSKLLSGDQQAMTEAVAPEAQATASQYDAAQRGLEGNLPRGAYQATQLASLPFQKASDIQKLYQTLRPEAAKQIQSIAAGVTGAGEAIAGLGMGEQGMGLNEIATSLQSLLSRRGQNVQESAALMKMIGDLAQAVGGGIGKIIAGGATAPSMGNT